MPTYRRPPLVERVVEFRCERDGGSDIIDRLMKRLSTDYPAYDDQTEFDFRIGLKGEIEKVGEGISQRNLRSADAIDLCILKRNSIGVSRQAPYSGWEPLKARAERAWKVWQKGMAKPKLSRIGSRSTNRIDIPFADLAERLPQDYVNVGFAPLPFSAEVKAFNVQRSGQVDRYTLIMNSSTIVSPLIDHQSLLLDIDLGLEAFALSDWAELAVELDLMNDKLNEIFEACVTDLSRELFNR